MVVRRTKCSSKCWRVESSPAKTWGRIRAACAPSKALKERRTHSQSLLSGLSALTTVHSCSFKLKHSSHKRKKKALDVSFSFQPVFSFLYFFSLSVLSRPTCIPPHTHTHLCIKDVSQTLSALHWIAQPVISVFLNRTGTFFFVRSDAREIIAGFEVASL